MAFGKNAGGRNYGPNAQFFYFQLKSKDLPEPVFEVSQKQGEELKVVDAGARFVQGNLIDIRNKEFKHNNKTIRSVSATFQDQSDGKNEVYFVNIPHTYLGRNILNSLLALSSYENVQIGIYKSKGKPDPKTGAMRDGFHSSAVRQGSGGDLVYGKFKNEELPKIPKIPVGDEVLSDTKEITEFFTAQVNELSKRVKSASSAQANASSSSVSDTGAEQYAGEPDAGAEVPDNEVPF